MFLCMIFGAGLLLVEGVTIPQVNPGRKCTPCLFNMKCIPCLFNGKCTPCLFNRKCTLLLTQVGSVLFC